MRKVLAWLLGVALAANGIFMLVAPAAWYAAVPTVLDTGPLNAHFVRDIGCAYVVAGGALIMFAIDVAARGAALAGCACLSLHALVHLWDTASGRESYHHLLIDLPPVFAPPVIGLWLAGSNRRMKIGEAPG
jgi:uncharacterized protein YjeT (DUF2065 family)